MGTVDADDRQEFKENLAQIEKEHGEQWDFCTCVIKNDSINKAVHTAPDSEIDRLFNRLEEIEQKCQAFLVQSKNATPEERQAHEKKVKKCLKDAGVK
jgi:tetrahydromethanopterin S-methyltransferase subunit G